MKGKGGKNENGRKENNRKGKRILSNAESSFEQRQRREGSTAVPPATHSKFHRVTADNCTVPPRTPTLLLGSRSVSIRTH